VTKCDDWDGSILRPNHMTSCMENPMCVYLHHIPNSFHYQYDSLRSYTNYLNIFIIAGNAWQKKTRTIAVRFTGLAVGIIQSTAASSGAVHLATQHKNKSSTFIVGYTTTDNINDNKLPVINIKNSLHEFVEHPTSLLAAPFRTPAQLPQKPSRAEPSRSANWGRRLARSMFGLV
jgi:hypothetical protein